MTNLADIWSALLLAQTVEEQATWARTHGLQLIEHVCLSADADLGQIELKVSPDEALAMHAEANPRSPQAFQVA